MTVCEHHARLEAMILVAQADTTKLLAEIRDLSELTQHLHETTRAAVAEQARITNGLCERVNAIYRIIAANGGG